MKDGTVENYNLNDADQKNAFEKKYGKILQPPPPPAQGTTAANKDIQTVDIMKENGKEIIRSRLKNGTDETYDLNDHKHKEELEKKAKEAQQKIDKMFMKAIEKTEEGGK